MNAPADGPAAAVDSAHAAGNPMPPELKRIWAEVQAFQANAAARAATAAAWAKQVDSIRKAVPSATVEDDGETVRIGPLSPGCAACKAGQWDCMFVTTRCNLDCAFCLRPRDFALPPMYSALGSDLDVLCARYAQAGVSGASFSGGEPFLEPASVLAWLGALRRRFPRMYLWAYTNGLTLSAELLAQLAETGLDELRFNLAATGYRHPQANRTLREAVARLPAVAVEIPAIPEQAHLLLESLGDWAAAGVKYLNLHELVYEPCTHSGGMAGARTSCTMPDGHGCAVHPGSAELIRQVLARVVRDGLSLAVNDCSLRNKARQMRGRRRLLAPFTLQPYERLLDGGQAECACLYGAERITWIHPEALAQPDGLGNGRRAVRLRRQLPLAPGQPGQWISFESMGADHGGR